MSLVAAFVLASLFAYYSARLAFQSWQFNDVSTANDATPLWIPQLSMAAGTIVLMIGLTYFVARTQLGRAMRATSFDRQAAEMMGIDVNRVIAATFFIGSALAGAAGVFNCLVYQQLNPYMGFQAGLKAFTAAVIGGIGNLPGAVVGGLAIGLAESFTIGYVSSTFSDAIVFVVLIGIMIVRPSGLLGRAAIQKV